MSRCNCADCRRMRRYRLQHWLRWAIALGGLAALFYIAMSLNNLDHRLSAVEMTTDMLYHYEQETK